MEDAELFEQSRRDPAAFGEIFDRHAAPLLRFLVRRVGREIGEGLLGELFRVAFERRERFDPDRAASARPWLYGIATHLILKHRRSEARRLRATAQLVAAAEPASGSDAADLQVDARVLWPRVADAIAELPGGERDALLLFVWEGQGYDDIAVALGIPVGTVRSRIHRARRRIRESVQPEQEAGARPGSQQR